MSGVKENRYAYLCDTHKCNNCSFPECSHTTDENYRLHKEGTEMMLMYSSDGVNYYMEFVKHPFLDKKFNVKENNDDLAR